MRAIVIIPEGKVAAGKLAGAVAYGAEVIQIQGSFDDALSLVVEIANRHPIALVNSLNPYRLEGQKTAAFEICDTLGSAPDWLCLPVGNAGNITAYWMGFRQYEQASSRPDCRTSWACRQPVPRRWSWGTRWKSPKRLPLPSASASQPAGRKHFLPRRNRGAGSSR